MKQIIINKKEEKDKLIALTPEEYIGIAPKLIDIK